MTKNNKGNLIEIRESALYVLDPKVKVNSLFRVTTEHINAASAVPAPNNISNVISHVMNVMIYLGMSSCLVGERILLGRYRNMSLVCFHNQESSRGSNGHIHSHLWHTHIYITCLLDI